ncbi:hypothetical protein V6N11_001335 [Hibiscus sabdariffa]|uniref:Uncharacterized protein n=1 Tax=Hibiscus sabdariffa TaxID=183260 RepID=A0ABR2RZP5_9ROSI
MVMKVQGMDGVMELQCLGKYAISTLRSAEPNLLVVGELKARGVAFKAGLLGVLAAGCIKGYTAAARCMCGVLAAWWCCSYMGI